MQQGYDNATARGFSLSNPDIYSAVESLRYGLIEADALRSFLFVLLGGVVLAFFMRGKLKMAPALAVIGVLVLGDLYGVNKRYLSHDSFAPKQVTVGAPIAMTPADKAILADTSMNYRVMDIPRFYSADPSYYHKTIGGYHAAKLTRYQDLIDRHLSHFTNGSQDDADWNVLNMLNARYVVGLDGSPLVNPEALGNAWWVEAVTYADGADGEMERLADIDPARQAVADKRFREVLGDGSPVMPGDTIYETTYAPDRLTYRARTAKGGVAVFSEVYFPWGWKATIDGQPAEIGRVNYVLRALRVPAGEHEIVMTFDPQSTHTTDTVAIIAIILIYIACVAAIAVAVRKYQARQKGAVSK